MSQAVKKLMESAAEAVEEGNLKKALFDYKMIVGMAPNEPMHKVTAGEICRRLEDKKQAIQLWRAAVEAFSAAGESLRALEVAKRILELDKDDEWTRKFVADVYSRSRKDEVEISAGEDIEIDTGDEDEMDIAVEDEEESGPEDLDVDFSDEAGEPEKAVPEPAAPRVIQPESLPAIPLLSELSRNAFIEALSKMGRKEFAAGEAIIQQGAPGDSMFFLVSGQAMVTTRRADGATVVLARLKEGDFFGEMALILKQPRTATVSAASPCVVLELTAQATRSIIKEFPSVANVLTRFYHERLLSNVTKTARIFTPFDEENRKLIISKFKMVKEPKGKMLLEMGKPADAFFIIAQGKAMAAAPGQPARMLAEGDFFGEASLLSRGEEPETVTLMQDAVLLRLTSRTFNELMMTYPQFLEIVSGMGMG
ncbi:MAG: hypothetical protein GMKNLPBB_00003 [Myxococcota bacterium]|nr:hypothetical protein [Myxococcota bacterium]